MIKQVFDNQCRFGDYHGRGVGRRDGYDGGFPEGVDFFELRGCEVCYWVAFEDL